MLLQFRLRHLIAFNLFAESLIMYQNRVKMQKKKKKVFKIVKLQQKLILTF